MQSISVPATLDLETVLQFTKKIAGLPPQEQYKFDFSALSWAYPFGMLLIAQTMKNLKNNNPSCEVVCENLNDRDATSYAAFMAFFTACGFDLGNNPSFKSTSNTYIPITYAQVKQINSREAIEDISDALAKQLTQQKSGILVDTLTYSFREVIRNVVEHSESDVLGYCAQYWPSKDLVELAILDTGIGLRSSLSQNPYLTLNSDQDALKYALMPGISGKTYEGIAIRSNDVWQNSGYGLYMNYRLCNEGGSFFICSHSRGLYRTKDSENRYYETNFPGTALRLRLKTNRLHDVAAMLKKFGDEGEFIAKQIGLGAIPNASTMSRMLKDNFKIDYQIQVGDTVKHGKFGEGTVFDKQVTPQGEMLWVSFNGGRKKKVLSSDVVLINVDTHTYYSEEMDQVHDLSDDISQIESEDFDFYQGYWDDN